MDFEDINKAVGSIQEMLEARVASRWYQMGVTLGAPVRELEIIRGMRAPANDSERMMLKAWLDNGDIKTWQWLADSVGHVAGGSYPKLAKYLAKKKPGNALSYSIIFFPGRLQRSRVPTFLYIP